MIINSHDGNLRIELLAQKVSELITSGVSSDKILILTLNSFKKEKILAAINRQLFSSTSVGFSQLKVFTFAGIAYNSILKNWVSIEELIEKSGGESTIIPTLSGLDASQYFFKKIIKEEDFSDYFSKKNLMHQLLRRYKLIVENSLSDKEVEFKSQILSESFSGSALKAINRYKIASSKNRIFDSLKQISSFNYLLQNGMISDFDNIEYFFADDVDEYSFIAFDFCKFLIKRAKKSVIFLDKDGCTREGYLCAYPKVYKELKNDFKMQEQQINSLAKIEQDAKSLYENIINSDANKLANFEAYSFSKRLEMIEAAAAKIVELHKSGVELNNIKIISPLIDEVLVYSLAEFLKKHKIKIQLLTGNKKITENLYVYALLTVLQLLNPQWECSPNDFDIRILLTEILQIPIFECENIIEHYRKTKKLLFIENCQYSSYVILQEMLADEEIKTLSILEQFEKVYISLIAPSMYQESDFEPLSLLSKSIKEFERIQENFRKYENIVLQPKDWLIHIKNSVVSETPSEPAHINEKAITISTAQKIVDFSLSSDYQIWLDTSSADWIKEDIGTIYNAWVFQKGFSETTFSNELNKKLTLEKTARSLRKLVRYAKEKIITYSSIFDASGRENSGELINSILLKPEDVQAFNFIPRDDQKEILEYSSGKLAVPAVPGAGKTTVMLALLVELVRKGVNPQQILVLTYMESAARNFLNRFKKITNQQANLPHISTIHSFAFKLLMENNNYALVNLPEDFSICDDSLKTSIVKEICSNYLPIGENFEDWSNLMLAAISKVKLKQISINVLQKNALKDSLLGEFMQVFSLYSRRLKELSLIDYDDLLLKAIELLKTNKNIAEFYQEKFQYIIEDEAQDSTVVQQELINILSKKYNNVIRCGDINQAILGTFSNSDVQGFKDYISQNKKIEMYRSQRCAKQIYEMANNLITLTKEKNVLSDAFYDLKMQDVAGKNPISSEMISYDNFETPAEEKEFVLNEIKAKLAINKDKKPTFAILLRTNKQVSLWASFVEKQGLKVLCRGDGYRQKTIFNFILAAIEMFANPWKNVNVANFYKYYCEIGRMDFDNLLFDYIQKLETNFLHPDFLKKNNIKNKAIETFWWESFSLVESQTVDIQEIIIRCANNYFDDITDKSNAYLFSLLVKRYENTLASSEKFSLNNIAEIIQYFKKLLSGATLKGINFFSKEDEAEDLSGFVQVMTIHKAKGAEFDYVFLPEFTDFNYMLNFSSCCNKITKRQKPLLSKIDKIASGKEVSVSQIAKEEINETLRLIYVAITRAKLGLKFSYSLKNDFKRDNTSVELIEDLLINQ